MIGPSNSRADAIPIDPAASWGVLPSCRERRLAVTYGQGPTSIAGKERGVTGGCPCNLLAVLYFDAGLCLVQVIEGIIQVFLREPILDWQREAQVLARIKGWKSGQGGVEHFEEKHVNLKVTMSPAYCTPRISDENFTG